MDCHQSYLPRLSRRFSLIGVFFILASISFQAQASDDAAASAANAAAPSGFFKGWKIAPEFMIALPQPLKLGVEAYKNPSIRPVFNFGYIKIPLGKGRSVTAASVEAGARFSPWAKWNFFGAAFGYRHLNLTTDISAFKIEDESLATLASVDLNTFYFAPTVGCRFSLTERLFIGFDVGTQIPLISSGSLRLEDTETGQNSDNNDRLRIDSDRSMSRVAGLLIPQVTLVRLTWYLN